MGSHQAAGQAAAAATKFDMAEGTPKEAAAEAAVRKADRHFHQMMALAHLSKMEVFDAEADLRKHQQTFDALQSRMRDKQQKMVLAAETKAKEEAPKLWKEKIKEMKEK